MQLRDGGFYYGTLTGKCAGGNDNGGCKKCPLPLMLLFVRNKTKPEKLGHEMKNRPGHYGEVCGEVSARTVHPVTEITIVCAGTLKRLLLGERTSSLALLHGIIKS